MNECRILVVDDDPNLLYATSRILKKAEYLVDEADSIDASSKFLKDHVYDLIIIDVMLRNESGYDLLHKLKSGNTSGSSLVVMISSVKTSYDDQVSGMDKGADGYITRPISQNHFLAYIQSLLKIKEAEKKNEELLEASRAILKFQEFEESARMIFESAKKITGARSGYVALLSDSGEENEVLFLDAGGRPCTVDPDLPMPIRGLRSEAYHLKKVVYDNDFHNSEWMKFMPKGHVRLDNVMFAPLTIEGKVEGIMGLANKPRPFNEENAEMAAAFGELAAIALLNSRLLGKLNDSLKEKETLLKEIHHRVKNNMNVISSLLKLHGSTTLNQEVKDALQESHGRVYAMSSV